MSSRKSVSLRPLAVIALVATSAILLAACGGSSSTETSAGTSPSGGASTSSSASGGSSKNYKVVTSADFAPLSFRSEDNPNEVVGFEVDMLKSVMDHLGWNYTLSTGNFNGLIPGVQSGRTDIVISDVYDTAERRQAVDFVDYLENGFAVLVRASDKASIKSFADLCGKKVGVITGSAPEVDAVNAASKKFCTSKGKPAIEQQSYPSVSQELPQLSNGHIDAIYEEFTSLSYIQKNSGDKYAVAFSDPTSTTKVGLVVANDSELEPKLCEAMKWYLGSSDYKQNAKKWGVQADAFLKPGETCTKTS